ncbi:bis(5'-nucleosyl)-tetraphosphatase [Crateriforma conspicua]|uniref:Bis(5'-nucleosyl)-tetraphosphatase [asymmetrical] n=1 Tax=Crateriforma conspicua TaxID=2527996 RepID=A0A5C5Y6Z4_9PLAN|nr:NUDIX domain-containing protein [Crateriforma conspicua]QDV65553.1 RNA pyrophosphohydrolase [Crateriforma conspicua]TWT70944.1 RNA pyrophosphohydrolase [Crateriforma conspicua]
MTKHIADDGKVYAAGVLLVTGDPVSEFLLMRHPNRWDLPKGHRDPGEDDLQTAKREMEEEIGVSPDLVRWDPDFRFQIRYPVQYKKWAGQSFEKVVTYFLGHIDHKPEIKLTEHEGFRWWTWAPPHEIQTQTIDPLLQSVAQFWGDSR